MPSIKDYMQKYDAEFAASTKPRFIDPNSLPTLQAAAPPDRSDLGLSLKAGFQQLPGIATGLADIPFALATGTRPITTAANWLGEQTGFQPGKWAEETSAQHTPEYKRQQAEIGQVWDNPNTNALDVAKAYVMNPMYSANQIVESLPSMAAGGVLSKGLMVAGRGLIPAAEGVAARATPGYLERAAKGWAAPIAGGVGEGAVQAGQLMDQSTGEDQRKNAIAALGSGALDALIAGGAGRLANRLGIETPETYMAKIGDKVVEKSVETGKELPSKTARIVGGMISEGMLQEFPQSFQEQVWQNFAEGKPLTQGAMRQAVEGAIAGAALGAGTNALPSKLRSASPDKITDDNLKDAVDQTLTPAAAPMQAEFEQQQQQFAEANQPQGTAYPGITDASDTELQGMLNVLNSERGKTVQNADEIRQVIEQELGVRTAQAAQVAQQERAAQQSRDLAARNDQEIAAAMAPQPEPDLLGQEWANRQGMGAQGQDNGYPSLRAASTEELQGTLKTLKSARGRRVANAKETVAAIEQELADRQKPESLAQRNDRAIAAEVDRAAREQAVTEGRDLFGNVTPQAENLSTSAATPSAADLVSTLPKTLRGQERARLSTSPIEDLPNRLYNLWEKKGGFGSTAGYVQDLDTLYRQITGQPIANHHNFMAQQASAAMQGFKESPTQGQIVDLGNGSLGAVPNLSKKDQKAVMAARRAQRELAESPAAVLGENIPQETTHAVQEPSTERVDVRQPAQTRQGVAEGNAQGQTAANTPQAQTEGAVNVQPTGVAASSSERAGNNTPAGEGTGGTGKRRSKRGANRSTGTPAGSNVESVVVGSETSEQAPSVAEEPTKRESPYARKKDRESELREYVSAYESLKFPENTPASTKKKTRIAYLTSIAEVEKSGDSPTTRNAATKYLESIPKVNQDEVAQARRKAETTVKNVSELEDLFRKQNEAIEKIVQANEATLAEYEKPTGKRTRVEKTLEKAFANEPAKAKKSRKTMQESGAAHGVTREGFYTQTELAVELAKVFGQKFMDAIKSGRVVILPNQLHLAAVSGRLEHRTQMNQGLYVHEGSSRNGVAYFVAGNISKTQKGFQAVDIALHEIGEHAGMKGMLGNEKYQQLMLRIQAAMRRNDAGPNKGQFDRDVAAAQARLLKSQQGQAKEVLAYMIQHTPDAGILQSLWAGLRAWLVRRGWMDVDNKLVTAQVLRSLARGATANWLKTVGATQAPKGLEPGKATIDFSGVENPETQQTLTNFSTAANTAKSLVERVAKKDWADTKMSLFKSILGWFDKHHILERFDKLLGGGISMDVKADAIQETMATRFNHMFATLNQRYEALQKAHPVQAELVGKLMQATEFRIDPRKGWEGQTHLHNLTGWQLDQAKRFTSEYRQIWTNKLTAEAKQLYNDLAQMNETLYTAELALTLYNAVNASPELPKMAEFSSDPSEKFRQQAKTHGTVEATQEYWRGVLDKYTETLDKYVAEQRGILPQKGHVTPEQQARDKAILREIKSKKAKEIVRRALRTQDESHLTPEQQKTARHLSHLEAQLRMVESTVDTFGEAPYFHLGRFGDNIVSFRVRMGENDLADPAAMGHVQRELAKEFKHVTIRSDATDPHVFARFESMGEAAAFEEKLKELQKQGWLMQPGVKDKNNHDLGTIVRDVRSKAIAGYHTAGPNWLQRVIESIQSQDYDDDTKARMTANIRSLYLDSLPDTAAIKVQQKREGVPGWEADMFRSYAHRMRVGSNRIGTLASEPTRTQAFATMKDALKKAGENLSVARPELNRGHAVLHELELRNSQRMTVPRTPTIDALRAVNHAFFLGLSPSYVLIQMTQLGVLTWPELAKTHGFVKAATTIGKMTPIAFDIIKKTIAEGYKQRGLKGAADMVVTSEMLEKAGLSEADAKFLVKVMAAGKIDIGNQAREIGRVAEGDPGSATLKLASSMGYMSETVTRLATALAAKRLYDPKKNGKDVVEYAIKVIDESMLNYSPNNIARLMGKQGIAGTITPVMMSFMQYQTQLLTKMYREVYNAFVNDPSLSEKEQEARKTEARRFLKAHMASTMLLAGSLGLPFATVVAAAADKLCGVFSDGYCDSQVALRNMTADVFGRDIEPLISRGLLPRAAGFDISSRAGEGDLLPFSKFLADKRKMDDRMKDLAVSTWGAPTSMIFGMFKGMEKMSNGDLLGGMQDAVPLALRGPLKAYQMSTKGYVDNSGNALPMSPGAWDMMVQTIGLNPGVKADYQQAKFAQSQRKGVLGREASLIRAKLATAIEQNDQSGMRDWLKKAQDYDSQNPMPHGILSQMGATLQQRARSRAQATATGNPLGVAGNDYAAQKLTSFYQP